MSGSHTNTLPKRLPGSGMFKCSAANTSPRAKDGSQREEPLGRPWKSASHAAIPSAGRRAAEDGTNRNTKSLESQILLRNMSMSEEEHAEAARVARRRAPPVEARRQNKLLCTTCPRRP